jgi:hypothetical protein
LLLRIANLVKNEMPTGEDLSKKYKHFILEERELFIGKMRK